MNTTNTSNKHRRGRGEGGIHKRADGRWQATLNLGWIDGKRRRKSIYGKTRTEVADKLRRQAHQIESGLPVTDARMTVRAWLEHWIENVLPGSVKVTTEANYATLVRIHVIPALGRHRLAKLEVRHVEQLVADLGRAGYKPNTVRLVRSTLRRALGHAERQGLVVRNVAAIAQGPRIPRPESRALSVDEVHRLLDTARGHRLEVAFVLLVETGMRLGEMLGLRWEDVDLDAGKLHVRRTLSTLRGHIIVDEPKTPSSRRPYELSTQAIDALRAHRARQAVERLAAGESWAASGHVLTTEIGTPLDPSNFRRRFRLVTGDAGIAGCHPHELRHTAASLMLARGVPLHVVSDVLGHSSITVTKDVYGHLVAGERRKATDAIAEAIYGP